MNTLERIAAALNRLPPVITDVGLILRRAEYEAMVRRQPTHWALRNPNPLDVTRSLWEQTLRGGLSRCRRLASVLAAKLVLA